MLNSSIEQQVSTVREALKSSTRVPDGAVRVSAHRETVELHGTLPSYRLARRVVDTASRAVRQPVRSRLRVNPRTHGDRAIARKIRARFGRHPAIRPATLVSRVHDGVVALDGYVEAHSVRRVARDIVRAVAGVRKIECHIVVDPEQCDLDRRLQAQLVPEIQRIPGFEACDLGVAAGRAVAHGVSPDVDPWRAERTARRAGAVSFEVA